MKSFFTFLFSIICLFKAHSQTTVSECLGIDTSSNVVSKIKFRGTLINMEMLPQGTRLIKELESRKRVLRNHHYYSIQVKLNSCGISEWFTCGDNKFRPSTKDEDTIEVYLSGVNYGDIHSAGGLPIIINHITVLTKPK